MTGLAISDFNIETFAGYLSNDAEPPSLSVTAAPFGQVLPTLMDPEAWSVGFDVAVVWTQPERMIAGFGRVFHYERMDHAEVLAEVEDFGQALVMAATNVHTMIVPLWAIPPSYRGYGMLDTKSGIGVSNLLMRMNLKLVETLERAPNIIALESRRWIESAGRMGFNPKLWYLSKNPFGNDVYKEAVREIKAALRGLQGQARKLLVLDLDDTLWGGILGDVGWQNLKLGGHDATGEAFVDFQRAIKSLIQRGVVLGIVSKNEEAVALEAIRENAEMVIRPEDLAGWRINWADKAQNLVEPAGELKLGLESVVFIDDNPMERARVREALPEVLVPEWPEDKSQYVSALLNLTCFDTPAVTKEDLARTRDVRRGARARARALERGLARGVA